MVAADEHSILVRTNGVAGRRPCAVGTVAGMGMKMAIGLVMIAWFFIDCFWVG